MRHTHGFTLAELIITLAIAAILTTMAVPSFTGAIRTDRLVTDTNTLITTFTLARTEAIKRGMQAAVCSGSETAGCGGSWNDGWIVFVDSDEDCAYTTGTDTLLRVSQGLDNSTLKVKQNGSSKVCTAFNSRGMNTTATFNEELTFTLCSPGLGKTRILSINPVGRANKSEGTC
ncbi:putative type-4 fimbrial pilin related signal peptide protein (plasmid) [Nitrosococcus oceani ATCC 19707]|uniref:Type II secretion system protein H n=2 Tax=Nitrosococcus oceani TaxID=1229 RepID=Q3JF76_NITOC|nr:GspH/FimT family pseudopilin [Nitrosococcus oceani]ABA56520.1 putative type-4 fimbrial pilin related signal peptide protein [Nitrosococcus oceani ATCC 19707]EDZ65247.1 Prokaryotic N-terminal methylation motif domain protein [Nitrosococcus oceani AFC27]KFI17786.1 general secretion pathway protein GspH [Nitrosococcus oceani C-27]BBM60795.1 general secretion pathway protein GspH [Nitrosococcus oceani]